jgi:uncharacterized protein YndB with AHSA1/START domain
MQSSATQDRPSVNITRHFSAPTEKVWCAWTDPQALARWFGPENEGVVSLAEFDVRVGGRYHIRFGVAGGEVHDVSGVYQEVGPELIFVHEQFYDQTARDGHHQGWAGAFAKLDRFLETHEAHETLKGN